MITKLKKADFIVLAIALVFCILLQIALLFNNKVSNDAKVVVTIKSKEVVELPLNENIAFRFYKDEGSGKIAYVKLSNTLPLKDEILIDEISTKKIYNDLDMNILVDEVVISIYNKKVQVNKETSPKHVCSNLGEVGITNYPLICAPNHLKVIIKGSEGFDFYV